MEKSYSNTEIERFNIASNSWKNKEGEMKMLHRFNPIRLEYIINQMKKHQFNDKNQMKILDFGCGGGILSEKMAGLGYNITGVDPASDLINQNKLQNSKVDYQLQDDFIANNTEKFDIIIASEVLEHVENVDLFFLQLCQFSREKSIFILSTINRTAKSLLLSKICAEYLLKLVPLGTHKWAKFVKPSEVNEKMEKYNFRCIDISGVSYNPIMHTFNIANNIENNYFITFLKC